MLKRLIKDEILLNLDFIDFGMCVDCIKEKQIKHIKKSVTRSVELLKIIHTDIFWPFDNSSFGREKYFITFIGNFLRYGHIYLLHEKSQAVDVLDICIIEIERQLDSKVKIIE